jgi:uncharacterized protein
VIAVDTNMLVYAHRTDSPFHRRAAQCIGALAEGRNAWAIPWACLHEFFATATHSRIYNPPTKPAVAVAAISAWLESPSLHLLHEAPDHWNILRTLIETGQILGPRVHDARIAAICLGNGARELLSADRDFSRFPHLTVRNPLVG